VGNVAFDDQVVQTQKYLLAATMSGTTVLGTIIDLLVASNVGSGFGDTALHLGAVPLATTTGNLPASTGF